MHILNSLDQLWQESEQVIILDDLTTVQDDPVIIQDDPVILPQSDFFKPFKVPFTPSLTIKKSPSRDDSLTMVANHSAQKKRKMSEGGLSILPEENVPPL